MRNALRGLGWLLLGLALVAGARPAAAQAPSQSIYGPFSVKLPSSSLFSVSDSFSAPASVTGPYLLRVELSAPNSLTTLSFKLNNVQVLSLADFAGGKPLVDRTVTVVAKNAYSLQIAGKAGTVIKVTVFATPNLPKPTSLAPDPLAITAGASGTLTATLSPAPTAAGSLSVTSADTAVATVPASVGFASGQASVPIPVTALASGSAIVTAAANGGQASATVNVTPAPPTVTSLAPASVTLTQGSSGTLTVTISVAQPSDTQVALASSDSGVAFVDVSATVAAGAVSAAVALAAVTPGSAQVTASLNGSSAASQVSVTAAAPSVVSLAPVLSRIVLEGNTTLILTLSAAQPADTLVSLAASPAGIVSVPASATVPAGQASTAVPIASLALGQAGISATLNASSASAIVNVVPPPAQVAVLEPPTHAMTVGATSAFTVRINAAQLTNTQIALTVDSPALLQVPASVTVAQGSTSAAFTATALGAGGALITAGVNDTQKTAAVQVVQQAAAIVSLVPSPLPLQQGATGSLTLTVNVAQDADTAIAVTNSAPAVVQVPASVTVPAGATSTTIPANALASGFADVTASVNATSATSRVEVTPPPPAVTSLAPAALTLPKGAPGVLRVRVSRAPNVPTAVMLSSGNPSAASVPASVNIAAGALFADFPVASNAQGQATITASLNGGSASALVTIAAAELVALTLSPAPVSAYIGESVPFTATGTLTDGTSEDFSTRVTWTSSNSNAATVASTGVASPLAAGQTTIKAAFSFTAAQTGQPVTVSQSTVLTVKAPTPLALSAPSTNLTAGNSVMVTITTSDPAPFGGLLVSFTGSGTGAGSFPATVSIPEHATSASFGFLATGTGSYTLAATAQNRLPATIAFTIQPQLAITSFTPAAGPVGTAVAVSGAGFDPNLSGNQVKFNGEPAVIVSGNAALLNVIVPPRATTGVITVTNFRGTVASATPFAVQEREAFDFTVAPAAIQVPPGGFGSTRIRLSSTGLNPYPYAASLGISGLPPGVTASFDRPTVALNQDAILTVNAAGAAGGGFTVTVTASGASGVTTQSHTKTLGLEVLAAGSTTLTGRVLHADDGAPFVGARVRLGNVHVFTDASGIYRFVNPPILGDQVLLIDGNTNNTAQFEHPSGIAMPVMIVAGQDNKVLTSYIGRVDATRFTSVVPGQAATVADLDVPNFSLNIQPGQTIIGWDGQPVTKINVRKVPVDRLPIRPIPEGVETRSVYLFYFFREGGGTPSTPVPVTFANDIEALPGEQVTLWYYDESATPDANSNQWRVMGLGTVSEDGKTIVSNPGVGMPKFCCGAAFPGRTGAGNTGANGGNGGCPICPGSSPPPQTDNPVDLASGNALIFRPRPFGLSIISRVNPNLQYRSTDPRQGLFGRGFSFTYDWFAEQVGSNAVRVTNPDGVQFMLSRESDGTYRSRAGRSGSIEMEITPTATGRTLRMADGTRYEFNAPGRLQAINDVAGNRTTFEVDALGFPFSITDPTGKVYEFALSGSAAATRINRITDPEGRFIEFTYDGSRRLTSYRDQGGGITQFAYDGASRISQVTDARLAVKTIEYDAAGRAVREVLPENAEERYAYSAVGNTVVETRYTDANGKVTTYRFNGFGFETSRTDALGRISKTELDPVTNQVRRRIDPAGRVTQYFYNARGDVVRTVDADNKETKIDYDPRFRKPTRIENSLGHVVTMAYDAQGNLTSSTNAELETTRFTHTAKGQLETITDPLNRVSRFTYDFNGNLANATNAAEETVTRVYDDANRLIELTDSLNRTTRFTYDALDRLTEVRDAAQGLTRFAYDANDNLLSAHDQNSNPVERNVYDLRNRLKQKTDAKNRSTFYEYDGVGNVVRLSDRRGQVTEYGYDDLHRLSRIQDQDGRVTTYDYDLAGNLVRISDTHSGDILMSYDKRDRLVEVVTAQGTVAYSYDAIGRRVTRSISGGDVTTYTYDKANRLTSVSLKGRTATYTYDAAGRLSERTLPNGLKATYQYDGADRITSIAYTKPDNSVVESVGYAYDAGGQRVQKTLATAGLQDTPFAAAYDEANRLTAIMINGEAFTLSYDDNGNLASKVGSISGTTSYSWDARNRLAGLSSPAGSAIFKYDALGRRIEKTVNGESTGFLYDGAQAIAELKGAALETVYHTGIAIDEVLARYGSSGNKSLLADALRSVIAQANDDQTIANFYAYSAYGEAAALGPDGGNPLRYTGREDDGTGLYYYRARYYDPVLKRFVSEDPIGIAGGINLYVYVDGDPISFMDPTGNARTSGGCQAPDPTPTKPSCSVLCSNNDDAEEKCKCEHRCRMAQCGTNARCILSSVNRQRDCISSAVGGPGSPPGQ